MILLQQIKEIWTQYPMLIAAFWRLGMTPVAAAEISAEVGVSARSISNHCY